MSNGTTGMQPPAAALPRVDGHFVVTLLLAGVASTLVWEVWTRFVVLMIAGKRMSAVPLIEATFGFQNAALAEVIHFATGLLAYPAGYLLVVRPLARLLVPALPWWLLGLLYGLALFVFALYVMASWFAGFPPFLGFTGATVMSLIGHLLFAVTLAGVVAWRRPRA